LDFLKGYGGADWKAFWPDKRPGSLNRDGVPSWDAVGELRLAGGSEWLLVEAKAHEDEFTSRSSKCGAGGASLKKIRSALRATYYRCGGDANSWDSAENMWLGSCYQLANRLACLRFLQEHGHPARLVYVYFVGDSYRNCPANSKRWRELINETSASMRLPERHALSDRIHYIFPDVRTGACK
jgi:hypothetical protein